MRVMMMAVALSMAIGLSPKVGNASHYRLSGISLVSKGEVKSFAKAGVTSTKALLEAGLTPADRRRLVKKTTLKRARIEALVRQCDLLRIEGVGPTVVRLFQDAGFRDIRALAKASPGTVWGKVKASNARLRLIPEAPSKDMISSWVSRARKLPRIVKGLK